MAKIIAPNSQFNGLRATVNFVNGVGETADPNLIAWFKSKGYTVEDDVPQGELTVAQIKERLDAFGVEYNKSAKKAELLELLEGSKPDPDADSGGSDDGQGSEGEGSGTETDEAQQ